MKVNDIIVESSEFIPCPFLASSHDYVAGTAMSPAKFNQYLTSIGDWGK